MIIVSGKAQLSPGGLAKVQKEMETVVTATRQEDGCIGYSFGADVMEPDTLIVLEYWKDWAALDAHVKQPHMGAWFAKLGEIGVVSQEIRFIEAGEERNLMG
ncbi:putative quinol monooxygenase [Hyphococcus luteus]|uniref:Antibiotic biosynthesis monooxygenase n=1 Tax=Hyphococcus luteus TaxID=2058213 RepID=A0A2S7K7U6_9PROT|nr:putative quinol monooxygenase [Marinicaulis flavus]PQA88584.1 antibiotic biosynthesis monooxygenase [Marinicaulis flavus]